MHDRRQMYLTILDESNIVLVSQQNKHDGSILFVWLQYFADDFELSDIVFLPHIENRVAFFANHVVPTKV
jgi:hypothetical protein